MCTGKIVTFLSCLVLLVGLHSPGFCQNEFIGLFGDTIPLDCNGLHLTEGDAIVFYVFHYSVDGATGSRFSVPRPTCLFGDNEGPFIVTRPFSNTTGDLESGVVIDYGECLTGWNHILSIAYEGVGLGWPSCCEQTVVRHPLAGSGEIEVSDCSGGIRIAQGLSGLIADLNETCGCVPSGIQNGVSTWGSIKALYTSK